ncbi:MAG: hypothetical protein U9R34_07835 [Nanoarchaeota archaeon]|nr:hypothetical protein [Nanoarchaeota archaeon]
MIELEKTYLAKFIPDGLANCKSREIIDIYIPKSSLHSKLRIRKNGSKYEITKKELINEDDASHQKEHTIPLTKEEFEELSKLDGKKIHKIRYNYPYNGIVAEIDIFQGDLQGLVVIEFEFATIDEKDNFDMPEFCLADVTQEDFIAGGMICGKTYESIEQELIKHHYKKLN